VRIPSGDLAPARRRRRGYGRRRNPLLPLLTVVLLVLVAGGVWYATRDDSGGVLQAAACPSPTASAASPSPAAPAPPVQAATAPLVLPAPGQVQMVLLNGSGRDLLARTVGNELAARGFRVAGMGNAPGLTGPSKVSFGPGARPAATLVAAQILGAQLVPVPTAAKGAVDVVLGTGFERLRTPAEATAQAKVLSAGTAAATPAATPSPPAAHPSPSPSCS
jgi:hypothetical protein